MHSFASFCFVNTWTILLSKKSLGFTPRLSVRLACGSKSISKTLRPLSASPVPIFIVLVVRIIFSIYRIKARWYNPTFFPPGHYVKGPLILDQGNSF